MAINTGPWSALGAAAAAAMLFLRPELLNTIVTVTTLCFGTVKSSATGAAAGVQQAVCQFP
jgi:short-subunit dehydrogenase